MVMCTQALEPPERAMGSQCRTQCQPRHGLLPCSVEFSSPYPVLPMGGAYHTGCSCCQGLTLKKPIQAKANPSPLARHDVMSLW